MEIQILGPLVHVFTSLNLKYNGTPNTRGRTVSKIFDFNRFIKIQLTP